MCAKKRKAFTLVELLVVIAIIAMLMGLLTPAIISARATARTAQCMNNMKNIGEALIQFDLAKQRFPGYADTMPGQKITIGSSNEAIPLSWSVMILPYLQRNDVWDMLRRSDRLISDFDSTDYAVTIDVFTCPSDYEKTSNNQSYVANTGQLDNLTPDQSNSGVDYPYDWPANGVFLDRPSTKSYHVTAARIPDGTQHTLLLSENVDAVSNNPLSNSDAARWNEYVDLSEDLAAQISGMEKAVGMVWWPAYASLDSNLQKLIKINSDDDTSEPPDTPYKARPSSNHPQGVNVVFCDGHAQFLREDIDYTVYGLLMTPDGKNAMLPGTSDKVDEDPWLTTPLNADDYVD